MWYNNTGLRSSDTKRLGVYTKALSTGLIQKDVEQIVAIALARAGAERRKAEADSEGDFFPLNSSVEILIAI